MFKLGKLFSGLESVEAVIGFFDQDNKFIKDQIEARILNLESGKSGHDKTTRQGNFLRADQMEGWRLKWAHFVAMKDVTMRSRTRGSTDRD